MKGYNKMGGQLSGEYEIMAVANSSQSIEDGIVKIRDYLQMLTGEIRDRQKVSGGQEQRRSIFDFVDLAAVVAALVFYKNGPVYNETSCYIDFVKRELLPDSESASNKELIATAFYCLMRCGLVHEMSLAGHGISNSNKSILGDYKVCLTHDSSQTTWYQIDSAAKEICFFLPELIGTVEKKVGDCFKKGNAVRMNVVTMIKADGVKIVRGL